MYGLKKIVMNSEILRSVHFSRMSCCSGCARAVIGIVNLIILIIIGVAIFVSWAGLKSFHIDDVDGSNKPFIFMIVVFAFVAITCIVGFLMLCLGQFKCFRITYVVMYIIIIIIEIVLVVVAVKMKSTVMTTAKEYFEQHAGEEDVQKIEEALKCCGYDKPYNETMKDKCGYKPTNETEEIPVCKEKIDDLNKKFAKVILIVGIIAIIFELFLLAFASWYAFCYKEE